MQDCIDGIVNIYGWIDHFNINLKELFFEIFN